MYGTVSTGQLQGKPVPGKQRDDFVSIAPKGSASLLLDSIGGRLLLYMNGLRKWLGLLA